MAKQFKVVKWFDVKLPDQGTEEWYELFHAFTSEDPSYVDDEENLEPQVLEGNLVSWVTEVEKYQGVYWTCTDDQMYEA